MRLPDSFIASAGSARAVDHTFAMADALLTNVDDAFG